MTAIFPALPGLGWSVTKTPRFTGRIQNAISGRELRVLDQVNPIWTWTLTYSLLRDRWDARATTGAGAEYDELRTLAGFFLQQQGRFRPFLFDDPTDNRIDDQVFWKFHLATGESFDNVGGFDDHEVEFGKDALPHLPNDVR